MSALQPVAGWLGKDDNAFHLVLIVCLPLLVAIVIIGMAGNGGL